MVIVKVKMNKDLLEMVKKVKKKKKKKKEFYIVNSIV